MKHSIRYAKKEDLQIIINFIDTHWKKDHALVRSKELMDFQHLNPISGDYNFIIAVNEESGEIDALSGYIPTYQFDHDLKSEGDYWGAIWKVRDNIDSDTSKLLPVYLHELYFDIPGSKTYGSIGLSKIAKKIFKALRHKTGILNHYYILNNGFSDFVIAKIENLKTKVYNATIHSNNVHIIDDLDISYIDEGDISVASYKPKKTLTFIKNKYKNHPIYKYKFWGIYVNGLLKSIWVIRKIWQNGANIIRIIDMYGDIEGIPNLNNSIQSILSKNNSEYIDCLNYGIEKETFNNIGFSIIDDPSSIIIPNYFEPFIKENIKVHFAYKSKDRYVIFKGDADQDRPNII